MLHGDLDGTVACEGDFASQKLEEHDSRGVEIGGLVDRRSPRLLGREVLRCADDRSFLSHLARSRTGDPEVGDLEHALGVDDDVVGLDMMDDAVLRCTQRGEDLPRARSRPGRGTGRASGSALECPPLDVLHDDV
jgi:hypothetical protein